MGVAGLSGFTYLVIRFYGRALKFTRMISEPDSLRITLILLVIVLDS